MHTISYGPFEQDALRPDALHDIKTHQRLAALRQSSRYEKKIQLLAANFKVNPANNHMSDLSTTTLATSCSRNMLTSLSNGLNDMVIDVPFAGNGKRKAVNDDCISLKRGRASIETNDLSEEQRKKRRRSRSLDKASLDFLLERKPSNTFDRVLDERNFYQSMTFGSTVYFDPSELHF